MFNRRKPEKTREQKRHNPKALWVIWAVLKLPRDPSAPPPHLSQWAKSMLICPVTSLCSHHSFSSLHLHSALVSLSSEVWVFVKVGWRLLSLSCTYIFQFSSLIWHLSSWKHWIISMYEHFHRPLPSAALWQHKAVKCQTYSLICFPLSKLWKGFNGVKFFLVWLCNFFLKFLFLPLFLPHLYVWIKLRRWIMDVKKGSLWIQASHRNHQMLSLHRRSATLLPPERSKLICWAESGCLHKPSAALTALGLSAAIH